MLGPVQAVSDDGPREVGGPKQRALLAELLLQRGRVVPREHLVDALWGDRPPGSAHTSLQVYVHALRRALGRDRIVTAGTGYRVQLEEGELDVERFEKLLGRAGRALGEAPSGALEDVNAALALWRGPPLADIRDQPLAATAVPRLEELRLQALELRGDALLSLGEHAALLLDLEPLIADHPYRERLREQQILALYRAGRQKDALEAFRMARATLLEDLGVDPGPALQQLERAILAQDPGLAAPVPRPVRRTELPVPMTPLVGRRLEIASVESMLRSDVRLVTLTGPGGTGKTRLAVAVADTVAGGLRDGAVFVDLSSVTVADALLPTVARALGVEGRDDELAAAAVDYLRERSLLLVLDNLEQLGRETQAIAALLSTAPRLRVLATSRVPLRLSGEHDYPVPPLPVPGASQHRFEELVANEAVRLFAARARAVDPSFALTDENLDSVVTVCRRLDGLPLALELAAAWIKVLSPAEIELRLGRALDVLVEGARDLPARQQTMRATLDWSFDLLDERGQRILGELSVFAGGWTIEDAEAVIGDDVVAGLAGLADHSLVRRRGDRFTVLETIREYAAERLNESGGTADQRRRHAERFVAVAERAYTEILAGGETETAAFAVLDAEEENLQAALAWTVETSNVEFEIRLAVALRWYWLVRGRLAEGIRVLERAAAAAEGQPALHAAALASVGPFNTRHGEYRRAAEQLQTARRLFAELGNSDEEARCIAELGAIAVDEGEHVQAAALYSEAADGFERTGNLLRHAVALSNLAAIATQQGDAEAAADFGRRAIELQRASDDIDGLAVSLANLGRARLLVDDEDAACSALRESFELGRKLGYQMLLAYLLGTAANLSARRGQSESAVRFVGAAASCFATIGMAIPSEEVEEHRRTLEPLGAVLGAERVQELLGEGRDESLDEMLDAASGLLRGG